MTCMTRKKRSPGPAGRISVIAPADTGLVLAITCQPGGPPDSPHGGGVIQLGIGHRDPPADPEAEVEFTIDAHIDLGASHVATLRNVLETYTEVLARNLGN